jgi:hypothetical protein
MSSVATNALSNLAGGGNLELEDLGLMDINGDGETRGRILAFNI